VVRQSEWTKMAKFALVGVLNTGVDFAVFAMLALALHVPVMGAQTLAYGAGVLNSYVWNRVWTFRAVGRPQAAEWWRFAAVQAASFGLATAVLLLLARGAGWHPAAAKTVSLAASLTLNYAGSRLWVFRVPSKIMD